MSYLIKRQQALAAILKALGPHAENIAIEISFNGVNGVVRNMGKTDLQAIANLSGMPAHVYPALGLIEWQVDP